MRTGPNMPDPRRCGERFMGRPADTGNGWSAIRADLAREAEFLRMAETAERVGCPETARKFRADAAAAVSRWRTARVSTFPGEKTPAITGQLSIF